MMLERLKERWKVKSGLDVVIILLVFACTGFSILYVKRALFSLVGINAETAAWIRWSVNIVIILPLYQAVLLAWGWIFGKFSFFWAFEKRMFARIAAAFRKKSES
jgi:hypothetical protein